MPINLIVLSYDDLLNVQFKSGFENCNLEYIILYMSNYMCPSFWMIHSPCIIQVKLSWTMTDFTIYRLKSCLDYEICTITN